MTRAAFGIFLSLSPDPISSSADDASEGGRFSRQEVDELWAEAIGAGNPVSLTVASDSMFPLIRTGDRILVAPFPAGEGPRVGDIVLFRTHDGWLVHRIIGGGSGTGAFYLQKGDAGHHSHEVGRDSIAGRIVRIDREDGSSVRLDDLFPRIVNASVGRAFQAIDWVINRGGDMGRDLDSGMASPARVRVSAILQCIERGVARAGSLLFRSRT